MEELVSKREFDDVVARVQLLERAQDRIVGEPIDLDDAIARVVAAVPALPEAEPRDVADVVNCCSGHRKALCRREGCKFA